MYILSLKSKQLMDQFDASQDEDEREALFNMDGSRRLARGVVLLFIAPMAGMLANLVMSLSNQNAANSVAGGWNQLQIDYSDQNIATLACFIAAIAVTLGIVQMWVEPWRKYEQSKEATIYALQAQDRQNTETIKALRAQLDGRHKPLGRRKQSK